MKRVRPTIQRVLDLMPTPAYLRNGRFDILAANDLGRALYSPLYEESDSAQHRPVRLPQSRRPGVLPRLRQDPGRRRRLPTRRSRTRPLRQGPPGPHRRTLHPQRTLPATVGGPRRPLPPQRRQEAPPPARRRPHPRLRSARSPRRRRPAPQHLHRATATLPQQKHSPSSPAGRSPSRSARRRAPALQGTISSGESGAADVHTLDQEGTESEPPHFASASAQRPDPGARHGGRAAEHGRAGGQGSGRID